MVGNGLKPVNADGNLKGETLIAINDLPPEVEQLAGRPVNINTIRSWFRNGVRGIKPESRLIGGRRFSSKEAITRFLSKLGNL